jgi:hypothetical protein
MRGLTLSAALAAACLGAPHMAMAQAGNTAGMVNMPGVNPTETSPVKRLSKPARVWIETERARQLAQPGDLVELAFDIQTEIGPAILKVAERERIDTHDMITAIMFDILKGASDELESDLRKMRRATVAPAELQVRTIRKAEIDARLAEVVKGQSLVSRALVANM